MKLWDMITIVLSDWLKTEKLKKLNAEIGQSGLVFRDKFSGDNARTLNRKVN